MGATTISMTVNGNELTCELVENEATKALVERLQEGPVTYTASDYGGFEKVGELGFNLPTSDEQATTVPGDVVLYQGDKVVVFYGENSWSYTRLGHISDHVNLKSQLGNGDVEITLSLQ